MAAAADLIRELAAAGASLWVEGGRLRCQPTKAPLSSTQRQRLRAHRDEVIALLAAVPVSAIADENHHETTARPPQNRRKSRGLDPGPGPASECRQNDGDLSADLAELQELHDRYLKAEALYDAGRIPLSNAKAHAELERIIGRIAELYDRIDQADPALLAHLWPEEPP